MQGGGAGFARERSKEDGALRLCGLQLIRKRSEGIMIMLCFSFQMRRGRVTNYKARE
jgi:hypothetical protein